VEETQDHLGQGPEVQVSLEHVRTRSIRGILTLTFRTFLLNIIALVAQGILWAYLSPQEFGVFFVVNAVVNFLVYFSDVGLAASLVQKKEEPTELEYRTTFTIQQFLVVLLLLLLFLFTPYIRSHYSLDTAGIYLLYAVAVSFFLSSLKSIPSVRLERKLEFGKLVLPQVVETLLYNVVLVFCAVRGLGLTSFTIAVLSRGIFGVIILYWIAPWRPGFALSRGSLKGLLKFGIPYQLRTFISVFKDDGLTIVLGGILGNTGMGILGTADKLAKYPLRFFYG
jgi:O-antigen/teichoic acid export membrane protein